VQLGLRVIQLLAQLVQLEIRVLQVLQVDRLDRLVKQARLVPQDQQVLLELQEALEQQAL
jgi:hypothetical protein